MIFNYFHWFLIISINFNNFHYIALSLLFFHYFNYSLKFSDFLKQILKFWHFFKILEFFNSFWKIFVLLVYYINTSEPAYSYFTNWSFFLPNGIVMISFNLANGHLKLVHTHCPNLVIQRSWMICFGGIFVLNIIKIRR